MPADAKTWRFGVLSIAGLGHVNPLVALALELKARGHIVTFFDKHKVEGRVRRAGLEFMSIDDDQSLSMTSRTAATDAAVWSDVSALHTQLKQSVNEIEMYLRNVPPLLAHSGVDALIIDEIALTGPTVAELLHLPYFVISTSVPHSLGWQQEPEQALQADSESEPEQLRKMLFELSVFRIRGPICDVIDQYRWNAGLGPVRDVSSRYPCLAQITQLPKSLDWPRSNLPSNFHYAGPFISQTERPLVEFPWDRLDGRPVIYASLGTTRNIHSSIFRMIAEACCESDAQLIISLGGRLDPEDYCNLPGCPLVVGFAPQLDLLKIASVVITHAGLNTVLETLMEGVPMIAIPIAHDQPAIAARLARLKLAEVMPFRGLSSESICTAVVALLNDSQYRESARKAGAILRTLRGVEDAADIIETTLAEHVGLAGSDSNPMRSRDYVKVSS